MSTLAQFAASLVGLRSEDMPKAVHEKLRLHLADTVGAWVAATATAEGRALAAFHECRNRDAGTKRRDVSADVARNCALARLSELDDIHLASMTTAGAIVIPCALTVAASLPEAEAADVTAAILAGYEAMIRLGRAIDGPSVLYRGIWPTYFSAPFGTAAIAARLLELDERQTAHALALALTSAAPGVGHHNAATTSRWFAIGNAARNGLIAAQAAQDGFTSDLTLLDGAFLSNVFGITPNMASFAEPIDATSSLMQVSFKPWCAARQTMAATQGLREIIGQGVSPADIKGIEAFVLPPHLKMIDHGVVAGDRASHLTSLPYQMAVAALTPEAAFDPQQSPAALPGALHAFMQQIKISPDDGLLKDYPSAWPARVIVSTASGRYERVTKAVPGDPARRCDEGDIRAKFMTVTMPLLGRGRAEDLFQRAIDGLQRRHAAGLLREIESRTTQS